MKIKLPVLSMLPIGFGYMLIEGATLNKMETTNAYLFPKEKLQLG